MELKILLADIPPFQAKPSGGKNAWWYVEMLGVNCLKFKSKPGAVFTSRANAEAIAKEWNDSEKSMPKEVAK